MPVPVLDPKLRAGWEPDTPVEDSLLRRFLVNWTTSIEAHGLPHGGRCLRRDDLAAVDLGRPSFGGNVATLLVPLFPDDVAEVTSALDDFYRFADHDSTGTVFLFSPWPTPDLRPRGWTLLGFQPLMLRPPGGELPPPPPGLRIEPVEDEAALRAFELAMVRGFASPELEAQGPGAAFGPAILTDDRVRLWVGWEGELPVAAAAAFVAAGVTDVTLVGTVPTALLLATDDGRPVYERMGYLPLFRFAVWSRDRPAGGTVSP